MLYVTALGLILHNWNFVPLTNISFLPSHPHTCHATLCFCGIPHMSEIMHHQCFLSISSRCWTLSWLQEYRGQWHSCCLWGSSHQFCPRGQSQGAFTGVRGRSGVVRSREPSLFSSPAIPLPIPLSLFSRGLPQFSGTSSLEAEPCLS